MNIDILDLNPINRDIPFSLGQRFRSTELDTDGNQVELTITRIALDQFGFPHITMMHPDGHESSTFAAQVDLAIAVGELNLLTDVEVVLS